METKEIFDDYIRINETVSIPLSNYINEYVAEKSLFRTICDVDLNPDMNESRNRAIYIKPDTEEPVIWSLPGLGYVADDYLDLLSNKVEVPIYTIQAAKDWPYNYMDREDTIIRAAEGVAGGIVKYEDLAGWKTIIPYTTTTFSGVDSYPVYLPNIYQLSAGDPASGYFSKELINRILVAAQRYRKNVQMLWVSPEDMADIREYTESDVDPQTRREIFQAAGRGSIWNIQLRMLNDLGVKGNANINSFDSNGGEEKNFFEAPFYFDKYGKLNDYQATHPNVVDEYGNLVNAGETQIYAFVEDMPSVFKMPIPEPYKARWDPNLIRRMKAGFFGWQKMGMCLLGQNNIYMGVIDRYVP